MAEERPQVWVSVEGGIAEAGVSRGDVEIIMWDWDVIDDTDQAEEILGYIEQAEQLPLDYPERENIISTMRSKLALLGLLVD